MVVEQDLHRGLGGVRVHVHARDDAARAVPQRSRHRTDAPGQLLVGHRPAPRAHLPQLRLPFGPGGVPHRLQARAAGLGEDPGRLVGRQRGQQDLAQGGGQCGEAGADLHGEGHDLGHGDPGYVDDVRAVELGDRAGLVRALHQPLQVRAGHVPQSRRADVGDAEVQDTRGQHETAGLLAYVAQLGQGEQDPACGRPGQPCRGRHVGQRHHRLPGPEGGDDLQAPGQRLDEIGSGSFARHGGSFWSPSASLTHVRPTDTRRGHSTQQNRPPSRWLGRGDSEPTAERTAGDIAGRNPETAEY